MARTVRQPCQPFDYQDRLFAGQGRQMGVSRAARLPTERSYAGSTVLLVSRSLQAASNLARYAW